MLIFGWSVPGHVVIPPRLLAAYRRAAGGARRAAAAQLPERSITAVPPLAGRSDAAVYRRRAGRARRGRADQPRVVYTGPYQPGSISSGAVPDWYMGFLDGALRIMPAWEALDRRPSAVAGRADPRGGRTRAVLTLVAAYPLLDGWISGGRPLPPGPPIRRTGLPSARRDHAATAAMAAAANDEIAYHLQVSLYTVTWVFPPGAGQPGARVRAGADAVPRGAGAPPRRGRPRHRDRPDRDDPGGRGFAEIREQAVLVPLDGGIGLPPGAGALGELGGADFSRGAVRPIWMRR